MARPFPRRATLVRCATAPDRFGSVAGVTERRGTRRRASRKTVTSNFGVGGRESHDATPFYDRFRPPDLSADDLVAPAVPVAEPFVHGDARSMTAIADNSVALVVTSPPYFAGKQYEEELEREGVPSSYLEYLEMLTAVFAECTRTLEPGGRIAVNVANLGRKPYRSLSADVIRILEHDLGLLLRGEVIWQKAEGAGGSCAWGSFRAAANPVLRDLTERVIIASKGRFDRARTVKQRSAEGLPNRSTILTDDFLDATLDVWSMPPESARRVGHPAPFPVELPEQLIRLYTYEDDLVLDPFMGSGSTLVAAARLGRRYVGYDLDPAYVDIARARVAGAGQAEPVPSGRAGGPSAQRLAEQAVADAGFTVTATDVRIRRSVVDASISATDRHGRRWYFLVAGSYTARRGGLLAMDVVWRTIGQAAASAEARGGAPLVVLTTAIPGRRSEGWRALHDAGRSVVHDVIDIRSPDDLARLAAYASGASADGLASGPADAPLPGFWPPP